MNKKIFFLIFIIFLSLISVSCNSEHKRRYKREELNIISLMEVSDVAIEKFNQDLEKFEPVDILEYQNLIDGPMLEVGSFVTLKRYVDRLIVPKKDRIDTDLFNSKYFYLEISEWVDFGKNQGYLCRHSISREKSAIGIAYIIEWNINYNSINYLDASEEEYDSITLYHFFTCTNSDGIEESVRLSYQLKYNSTLKKEISYSSFSTSADLGRYNKQRAEMDNNHEE